MSIAEATLPDVETTVIQYLKAHAAVLDALPGASPASRISGDLPAAPVWPYLTVAMGGGPVRVEGFLVGNRMQGDAYGGTREQARALALVAHAALAGMRGTFDGVIVTGAETLASPRRFPSPDGRARYTFDVRVWATPGPDLGS